MADEKATSGAGAAGIEPTFAVELASWEECVRQHRAVELELYWPIQYGSEKITKLTIRPPIAAHAKHLAIAREQLKHEDYLLVLANACALAPPIIDQLSMEDAARGIMVIELFWRGSRATSASSSAGS